MSLTLVIILSIIFLILGGLVSLISDTKTVSGMYGIMAGVVLMVSSICFFCVFNWGLSIKKTYTIPIKTKIIVYKNYRGFLVYNLGKTYIIMDPLVCDKIRPGCRFTMLITYDKFNDEIERKLIVE